MPSAEMGNTVTGAGLVNRSQKVNSEISDIHMEMSHSSFMKEFGA